jgi:alpha-1,2-glucosyltransferase
MLQSPMFLHQLKTAGDKSNHVATIHFPQMLYIWPFMALLSMPLLLPMIVSIILSFLPSSFRQYRGYSHPAVPIRASTLAWLLATTGLFAAVVHFNTIIHPFTLADNRHYVFYVFRYTIRRHPFVKYALTPIYALCGWLVFRCLGGSMAQPLDVSEMAKDPVTGKPTTSIRPSLSAMASDFLQPNTAFALIWLISTALSLITAPLVEPRYFIIPWVIWRLHFPRLPSTTTLERKTKVSRNASRSSWAGWMKDVILDGHDYRLWLETFWFLLMSAITGAIFLNKGFEWPQEPGKVQRFMW